MQISIGSAESSDSDRFGVSVGSREHDSTRISVIGVYRVAPGNTERHGKNGGKSTASIHRRRRLEIRQLTLRCRVEIIFRA